MGEIRRAVREYYKVVDTSPPENVVALFHERARYRRPGYEPLIGRDALLRFYRSERVIDSGHHEITQILCDGSVAAVEGRFAGRLKNGDEVKLGFADFFRLVDGLIVERSTYFERPAV